jgi:hypothetical protein
VPVVVVDIACVAIVNRTDTKITVKFTRAPEFLSLSRTVDVSEVSRAKKRKCEFATSSFLD